MLDWFQFHFNPEPISGFALDLISSQYNTIVCFPRFTLTRGQMVHPLQAPGSPTDYLSWKPKLLHDKM